jgi:hypothetical protein
MRGASTKPGVAASVKPPPASRKRAASVARGSEVVPSRVRRFSKGSYRSDSSDLTQATEFSAYIYVPFRKLLSASSGPLSRQGLNWASVRCCAEFLALSPPNMALGSASLFLCTLEPHSRPFPPKNHPRAPPPPPKRWVPPFLKVGAAYRVGGCLLMRSSFW